jgi:hypothetical protein
MKLEITAAWWLNVRIQEICRSRTASAIDSSNNFNASSYLSCCNSLTLLLIASLNRCQAGLLSVFVISNFALADDMPIVSNGDLAVQLNLSLLDESVRSIVWDMISSTI